MTKISHRYLLFALAGCSVFFGCFFITLFPAIEVLYVQHSFAEYRKLKNELF